MNRLRDFERKLQQLSTYAFVNPKRFSLDDETHHSNANVPL